MWFLNLWGLGCVHIQVQQNLGYILSAYKTHNAEIFVTEIVKSILALKCKITQA